MPEKVEAPSLILLVHKGFSVLVGNHKGTEEPYRAVPVFRDLGGRGGKGEVRGWSGQCAGGESYWFLENHESISGLKSSVPLNQDP